MGLLFSFATFVASIPTSGSVVDSGFTAVSGVGSRVEILSQFFIENNQLLKLLRAFSLALSNNPNLISEKRFFKCFYTFFKILFFNKKITLLMIRISS